MSQELELEDPKKPSPSPSRIPRRTFLTESILIFIFLSTLWISNNIPLPIYHYEYSVCSESGNIYTVDEVSPLVECISIVGSRISYTGGLKELQERLHRRTQAVVSHKVSYVNSGAIIVPGLADAHAHIMINGFKMQLELDSCKSLTEVLEHIKAYIYSHPDVYNNKSQWIEGGGWDQTKWPETGFPHAADFDTDPLLTGRPIALQRVDAHASWVSTRVLEIMGDIPQKVEGGSIVRDSSGNPTGIFLDNAMSLIPVPEWTDEQMTTFFDTTMKLALSYGLTSIHDAGSSPKIIQFMKKQAEAGNIPMRLYIMGHVSSDEYWGSQIPRLINYGKHGHLTIRSVKLVTDGALGSWGAALLEPYSDKPDTSGIMRSTPKTLFNLVKQFWKDGWQVNIHCIGDRANHVVLDIYQELIEMGDSENTTIITNTTGEGELVKANVTEWRPRIEHAQIMTIKDLRRTSELGIITSVQPTHATSDMWYAETRLGPNRIKGAYAYRTLLSGSPKHVIPLGSDFPVENVNPLLGFYAAVSRLSVDGTSPHGDGGWYASEALTRAQALKGMTLDAAYASFTEHELGSLTPGKKADFVVLDRNIMQVPFEDILKTKVVATVVNGKVAYGAL
ncbi:amidohydrolase family-domain-containing protein [Lentinula lateritia]|uniref:Amidohydrolase family-domain-containing protein n=1 Tax=Lentinula aff. lateritia TaxID=2804960 RepID=A0ACC1TLI5_9AGAR|nr:amidohydrolase family-domain-containing protein [Lentinula aff. lateritia]KAJ3846965.1 amidohydrolase family-domain-containing protein [Lentinula lateritia]